MKIFKLSLLLIVLLLSCKEGHKAAKSGSKNKTSDEHQVQIDNCGFDYRGVNLEDWTLIFEDNFSEDLSNWNLWNSGAFNEELQYYQAENIALQEGYLLINGKRESARGKTNQINDQTKEFEFTSGRLESKKHFGPEAVQGMTSVRFSARLRLPDGVGLWPAWWSYNDPWPTKGEIDILEARGNTPSKFQSCFHYGSQNSIVETDAKFNEFHYKHQEPLTTCFHVYDLIWTKDRFQILFDGKIVKSYDEEIYNYIDDFFGMKHKLVLNLAIGGWFFDTLDTSLIPDNSQMVVDWVKVYSK